MALELFQLRRAGIRCWNLDGVSTAVVVMQFDTPAHAHEYRDFRYTIQSIGTNAYPIAEVPDGSVFEVSARFEGDRVGDDGRQANLAIVQRGDMTAEIIMWQTPPVDRSPLERLARDQFALL